MPLNCSYGFASFGATKNLPAKITIVPSTTSTTEGGTVNFTVVTQNLPSPLTFYWTVSGLRGIVGSADFSTDAWGTYDDSNNTAVSGNVTLAIGHQTGTNKTFYYAVKAYSTTSRTISTSTAVTIISPVYTSVTVNNNLMYEGEGTSTFTVNTSGCVDGTVLYYTARATVGSISGSSFNSGVTYGSFIVNSNIGTFSFESAAEDGNNTDDTYVVDIRTDSITGPVVKTSPTVKIVDLTTYYNTLANKFGGSTITYTVAGTSSAAQAGGNTTITFKGVTVTGSGGGAGGNGAARGTGGTFTGGDGGIKGGDGVIGSTYASNNQNSSAISGGAGGPGNANGGGASQYAGGWWAYDGINFAYSATAVANRDTASSGFWTATKLLSSYTNSSLGTAGPGSGSNGVNANILGGGGGQFCVTYNLAPNVTAYRFSPGGIGNMGGGGGGAGIGVTTNASTQYTFYTQTGGAGGGGWVTIQYDGGSTGRIASTNGSVVVPNGVTTIKVWALGAGGGGGPSTYTFSPTAALGSLGAGGGAGGIAWKTYTWGPAYYPTKPTLA
jgi:hypothetical protein